jgi:hypothetical protein
VLLGCRLVGRVDRRGGRLLVGRFVDGRTGGLVGRLAGGLLGRLADDGAAGVVAGLDRMFLGDGHA